MNIFILDKDIKTNVEYYPDKHIVKMGTEMGQMISAIYHIISPEKICEYHYKKASYINHPCTIWMRESLENFLYGVRLGLAILNEYYYRYERKENFIRLKNLLDYSLKNPPKLKMIGLTKFARAIKKDKYPDLLDIKKYPDTIEAYREYFRRDKKHLFKWTKRNKPNWLN